MTSLELKVPPPVLGLFVGLCMWLISSVTPPLGLPFALRVGLGVALAAAGVSFSIAGMTSFRRAKTTMNPTQPGNTSSLVTGGIYGVTRNPMYLGLLLDLLGWAAYLASPLAFLCLPIFFAYINRFQIQPEERALSRLFGEAYAAYQQRVRRWL
jgi:protein-S-isoprenylcysteine O-methyltransferase Ste14